jgi:tetratricopeptide (TPR) repeat protein
MAGLAAVYQARARYAEAEPFYRRALSIVERALGPDHAQAALPLGGLAALYNAEGRYREAEPLYRRTLAIQERAMGSDHPALAGLLDNYAVLLRRARRDAEALEIDGRARDIRAHHAIQNPRR